MMFCLFALVLCNNPFWWSQNIQCPKNVLCLVS